MQPTAMEAVAAHGTGYVILASAAGNGSAAALSVMQLTGTGRLVPTDHVLDTLNTRFGQVQSLSVVQSGDHVYVLAAGGDDGLTLLELLPGGRLFHHQSIADSAATGLQNVSALAGAVVGDEMQVIVASQSEAGLTQFSLSLASEGAVRQAGGWGRHPGRYRR